MTYVDIEEEDANVHSVPTKRSGSALEAYNLFTTALVRTRILRYQLLQGRKAKFVPGWDTHGLPIELKVLQSLPEKERKQLVRSGASFLHCRGRASGVPTGAVGARCGADCLWGWARKHVLSDGALAWGRAGSD